MSKMTNLYQGYKNYTETVKDFVNFPTNDTFERQQDYINKLSRALLGYYETEYEHLFSITTCIINPVLGLNFGYIYHANEKISLFAETATIGSIREEILYNIDEELKKTVSENQLSQLGWNIYFILSKFHKMVDNSAELVPLKLNKSPYRNSSFPFLSKYNFIANKKILFDTFYQHYTALDEFLTDKIVINFASLGINIQMLIQPNISFELIKLISSRHLEIKTLISNAFKIQDLLNFSMTSNQLNFLCNYAEEINLNYILKTFNKEDLEDLLNSSISIDFKLSIIFKNLQKKGFKIDEIIKPANKILSLTLLKNPKLFEQIFEDKTLIKNFFSNKILRLKTLLLNLFYYEKIDYYIETFTQLSQKDIANAKEENIIFLIEQKKFEKFTEMGFSCKELISSNLNIKTLTLLSKNIEATCYLLKFGFEKIIFFNEESFSNPRNNLITFFLDNITLIRFLNGENQFGVRITDIIKNMMLFVKSNLSVPIQNGFSIISKSKETLFSILNNFKKTEITMTEVQKIFFFHGDKITPNEKTLEIYLKSSLQLSNAGYNLEDLKLFSLRALISIGRFENKRCLEYLIKYGFDKKFFTNNSLLGGSYLCFEANANNSFSKLELLVFSGEKFNFLMSHPYIKILNLEKNIQNDPESDNNYQELWWFLNHLKQFFLILENQNSITKLKLTQLNANERFIRNLRYFKLLDFTINADINKDSLPQITSLGTIKLHTKDYFYDFNVATRVRTMTVTGTLIGMVGASIIAPPVLLGGLILGRVGPPMLEDMGAEEALVDAEYKIQKFINITKSRQNETISMHMSDELFKKISKKSMKKVSKLFLILIKDVFKLDKKDNIKQTTMRCQEVLKEALSDKTNPTTSFSEFFKDRSPDKKHQTIKKFCFILENDDPELLDYLLKKGVDLKLYSSEQLENIRLIYRKWLLEAIGNSIKYVNNLCESILHNNDNNNNKNQNAENSSKPETNILEKHKTNISNYNYRTCINK